MLQRNGLILHQIWNRIKFVIDALCCLHNFNFFALDKLQRFWVDILPLIHWNIFERIAQNFSLQIHIFLADKPLIVLPRIHLVKSVIILIFCRISPPFSNWPTIGFKLDKFFLLLEVLIVNFGHIPIVIKTSRCFWDILLLFYVNYLLQTLQHRIRIIRVLIN